MEQRYYSGEEIHIGDRVEFCGCPASITLVIDREEWPTSEGADSRAWWRAEHRSGFVVRQDAGAEIILPEADEDLIFVSRAAKVA
jgi:hypothetical protein